MRRGTECNILLGPGMTRHGFTMLSIAVAT